MKIGVLQFFGWPDRRVPLESVYAKALERIEIMDRTGYEAVWLAEHHFQSFSVCPSIHMMATMVAARTKRIRIGTAVSLAAFYHPLRLAEEVALLDVLSGGRVNWGAGRGSHRQEFESSACRPRRARRAFARPWTWSSAPGARRSSPFAAASIPSRRGRAGALASAASFGHHLRRAD